MVVTTTDHGQPTQQHPIVVKEGRPVATEENLRGSYSDEDSNREGSPSNGDCNGTHQIEELWRLQSQKDVDEEQKEEDQSEEVNSESEEDEEEIEDDEEQCEEFEFTPKKKSSYEITEDDDIQFDYNSAEECHARYSEMYYGSERAEEEDEEQEEDEDEDNPPEWYNNEDSDQLKEIFHMYSDYIGLTQSQQNRRREPEQFIGRITRQHALSDTGKFLTYDIVEVFRRSLLPPGSQMPLLKTYYILTTWNVDEGLPFEQQKLSNKEKRKWENLTSESSFLFCEPVFSSSTDYDYAVSSESHEIRHSRMSYPHHCYIDFLPLTQDCSNESESPNCQAAYQ